MPEVKETKAQKVERLKREKLAWDHLDEIRDDMQLGALAPEIHGGRDVDDCADGDPRSLTMDAHEPLIGECAQARAKIEPSWIRPVVEAHMRDELLSGEGRQARMLRADVGLEARAPELRGELVGAARNTVSRPAARMIRT